MNSINEILVNSYEDTFATGSLITVYNSSGKMLKQIGKIYYKPTSLLRTESIFVALDKDDNILISYYGMPFFWKYSRDGEVLMVSAFDMPGKKVQPYKEGYKLIGNMNANASSGISIDQRGQVYIITSKRAVKKEENFFVVGTKIYPENLNLENTDRFRLLVFNPEGKIIAAKNLNVYCDRIYVHKDTLFIINTCMGAKIYEYKISFIGNSKDEQGEKR